MKIYICIDCQNDFIDETLGNAQAQIAVSKICKTLWKADHDNSMVCLTRDTHFDDYFETQEGKNLPIAHCIKGTYGWKINDEIADAAYDFANWKVYDKYTFGSEDLVKGIHNLAIIQPIEEIILMGFCTDICVISNALMLKAAEPEIPIKVIASCCAGVTPEKHQAALEVMKSCQIEVI